jgi:hypothetical protein
MVCTIIAIVPFSWILEKEVNPILLIDFLKSLRLVKIWPFYRAL